MFRCSHIIIRVRIIRACCSKNFDNTIAYFISKISNMCCRNPFFDIICIQLDVGYLATRSMWRHLIVICKNKVVFIRINIYIIHVINPSLCTPDCHQGEKMKFAHASSSCNCNIGRLLNNVM